MFTPNEIERISRAVGNFRIKHDSRDDFVLEQHRSKIRSELSTYTIPEGIDREKLVEGMYNGIRDRFLRILLIPGSSVVMNAGSDIMAPLIQEILNSHKNAGREGSINSAGEILTGSLVRTNEHICVRINGDISDDLDKKKYEAYGIEILQSSKYNYSNLVMGGLSVMKCDDIPFYNELKLTYKDFKGLCVAFDMSLSIIHEANLDPQKILDDLRVNLKDYSIIMLHKNFKLVTIYINNSGLTLTNVMTAVKNLIDKGKSGGRNKVEKTFSHYDILESNLHNYIKSHYEDTDIMANIIGTTKKTYVLYINIQNSNILMDLYVHILQQNGCDVYATLRNKINKIIGLRYVSDNIIDFKPYTSHRLRLYGPSSNLDYILSGAIKLSSEIDISNSYTNNIYTLSKKLGIVCLIPHLHYEWSDYNLTQNQIMQLGGFMCMGDILNPVKHSSIAREGPLSAMAEDAKGNMIEFAQIGMESLISGPQSSIVTGVRNVNCGVGTVTLGK